jgi:uncharacterized membrane protein (TIGR01666 family)
LRVISEINHFLVNHFFSSGNSDRSYFNLIIAFQHEYGNHSLVLQWIVKLKTCMNKINSSFFQPRFRKFQQTFWRHPHQLYALRATISMGLLAIPFMIAGKPFYGVTLALGALAGALSETDDHPKGRTKALLLTVISFFISSFSVGLLYKNPWLLGTGFVLSTIAFILIGGLGERYRAITFGAVLVGIYAMLGIEISPAWYWQAVLLPSGALVHGLLTLIYLYHKPWRLLDEQMAEGFKNLSAYLEKKAMLFPSIREDQALINNDLALLNISVVNSLEKIKEVLNNYGRELKSQEPLRPYLQRFMLLQSLHERAASTHERHDKLSNEKERLEVMEGLGEMLRQLAYATKLLAENMLTGSPYHHPVTMEWISKSIDAKLQDMDPHSNHQLILLHHNLHRSHLSLKYLDNEEQGSSFPRLRKDERSLKDRLIAQLTIRHPRMRYALRLSISFLVGFVLAKLFHLEKGAWVVLTSLFVSQITYIDTRRRLFQRLMGTITGVISGVLLLQIFTTTAGQVILMLLSAMAFFYWIRTWYSVAVIFITIFVISAFNVVSNDGGFHIMIPRLIDTLLGASISFMVIRILWPGWQYRRMPELISLAMKKNVAYLKAIENEYEETSIDDLAYRIARREAHLADNELAQAWRSMRIEPKSKQKLMQHAFTLTYLNHALLSYISAMGAHRENDAFNVENIKDMTGQISAILTTAGEYLLNEETDLQTDLSPILMELKQQINSPESIVKKQLLRLFYNIASTTAKILKELQDMKSGKEA